MRSLINSLKSEIGRVARKELKAELLALRKATTASCGIERQFDIYWEYELGGLTYKTAIECKDYRKSIPPSRPTLKDSSGTPIRTCIRSAHSRSKSSNERF